MLLSQKEGLHTNCPTQQGTQDCPSRETHVLQHCFSESMSEDLLLQDMLAYPKSKAQIIDPKMELISPLAIHMNIQLQLFECP